MSNTIHLSSEIIDNNKLNTNDGISCVNLSNSGGRIWAGIDIEREKDGMPIFKSAKCAHLKPEDEIYHFKKDSFLDNYCDCELVDTKEGKLSCPSNKMISTYYPLLNRATCCSPCSSDNKLKTIFPDDQCKWETMKPEVKDVSCSPSQYMKSFEINKLLSKIECCTPQLTGEYLDEHNNNSKECNNMELDAEECNEKNVKNLMDKCNQYGIKTCNMNEIKRIEDKCDKYGMKYYDSTTNTYKNTDSYLSCHLENFDKLDQQCAKNNISNCNFYELRDNNIDSVTSMKSNFINIDKIEDIFETKFKAIETKIIISKILLFLFILIITIIVLIILFFIYKKHSNDEN